LDLKVIKHIDARELDVLPALEALGAESVSVEKLDQVAVAGASSRCVGQIDAILFGEFFEGLGPDRPSEVYVKLDFGHPLDCAYDFGFSLVFHGTSPL
jgi:hypothetical protein